MLHCTPCPAPREAVRIISTRSYERRLFPGTSDYSYAVGIVTIYSLYGGPEQRMAQVATGRTWGDANMAAGRERYCAIEALRRAAR